MPTKLREPVAVLMVTRHLMPLGVDMVCMTPPLLMMGSIFPIGDLVSIPGGDIFYMRAKKTARRRLHYNPGGDSIGA